MQFVFLTPEFITNSPTAGGLATYLGRLSECLVNRGYDVNILVPALDEASEVNWRGVLVSHVAVCPDIPSGWYKSLGRIWGRINTENIAKTLHNAHALAEALESKQYNTQFQVVHGADYGLTTWYVRPRNERCIVVRASSRSAECRRWWSSQYRLDHILLSQMELQLFRRANIAYAPSRKTAEYYEGKSGVPFNVIRPPFPISEVTPNAQINLCIPVRFLLHFGNIDRVKGSDVLAEALRIAWRIEPDLQMVWAGSDSGNWLSRFRVRWGSSAHRVQWLGPLTRAEVQQVLLRSAGVVAPSRVDNLPNSVLEAQAAGIPVIGTFGSSIDEIVVDGTTGKLVRPGNPDELAQALVSAWRGESPFHGEAIPLPPVFSEMDPDFAVSRLLESIQACRERASAH